MHTEYPPVHAEPYSASRSGQCVLLVLGKSKLYIHNMNKKSRDTSSVLSEWHDRGERRPISSGDSMAYEYALRGCLGFILSYMLRR